MTVAIRQLKNHLSDYLRRVQRGERVVVTAYGRPVAEIRAVEAPSLSVTERLREMEEAGELTSPQGSLVDFEPTTIRGRPLSQTLLEDR